MVEEHGVLLLGRNASQGILRRIFCSKRCMNGDCRRLHKKIFDSLHCTPHITREIKSRRFRWVGHSARMEEVRSAFKILTVKPIGKRPLERPVRRYEDNIRMHLKEIGTNTRN